jgi:hypothetical protein
MKIFQPCNNVHQLLEQSHTFQEILVCNLDKAVLVLEALGPEEVGMAGMAGMADEEVANDDRSHHTNLVLGVGTEAEAEEELVDDASQLSYQQ